MAGPLLSTLARTAVSSITVKSTLTPDVRIDPFSPVPQAEQVGFSPANLLLGLLRPSVYVETPAGTIPIEPYGKPDANYMPLVLVTSGVVLAVVGYFAWLGLTSTLERRRGRRRPRKRGARRPSKRRPRRR